MDGSGVGAGAVGESLQPEVGDGVACEPGSMIRSDNGEWWLCGEDGKSYEPLLVPKCTKSQVLVYDKEGFVCRELEHGNTLALWVMGVGLALTIFGILGMGARQWWMDRRKKKREKAVNWEELLAVPGQILPENVVLDTSKPPQPAVFRNIETGAVKEIPMADTVDKNPDSLQDEIKEIYSLIQTARSDVNKIPGFMQVCVNSAMENLNKARDRICALGGKVK